MKSYLYVLLIFIIIMGCSSHYIKKNNDDISFYLKDNNYQYVYLYLDMDSFTPHRAIKKDKYWIVTIKKPKLQEIRYFYKINNKPFTPTCQLTEYDDFGSKNCILKLSK